MRLARGERKGKKGKGRNDDFIPPPPPPRLIPAAKIFARTVEDHRARGKVYVYRAREVQTEDETRRPPSIFSSSTPIPSTRAEQRLGRGRFLQVRFVWVSTMRGWRGFSLFSSRPPSPFLSPGAAWFPISCSNDDAIYGEIKTRELGSFRPLFYSSSTFSSSSSLFGEI